jgi:thioredoxin 1
MLHHADDSTFPSEVIRHPGPVLVEFFTQSCGPCRQLEPHLRGLADQLQGRLKIVKVDSERSPGVAAHYDVRMAPTFIVFLHGQPRATIQGAPSLNRLKTFVQSFL